MINLHISAGKWLKKNASPDDLIVLYDAGAIPYYSGLNTLDTWSLNNWQMIQFRKELSLKSSEEKKQQILENMREYVMNQDPDFIVQDHIGLLSRSEVHSNYERIGPIFTYLEVVPRKDSRNPFVPCQPTNPYEIKIWRKKK